MSRQIPLTHGYVATVDDEDYEWLMRFRWHTAFMRGRPYARANCQETRHLCMHRLIMGDPDGVQIDHWNDDSLDNRKDNLRLATPTQNRANAKIKKDNSTGFKGVHQRKVNGRFQAYVSVSGKRINLGHFATAEEAARAYDAKAREVFGTFARLNFPTAGEQGARRLPS